MCNGSQPSLSWQRNAFSITVQAPACLGRFSQVLWLLQFNAHVPEKWIKSSCFLVSFASFPKNIWFLFRYSWAAFYSWWGRKSGWERVLIISHEKNNSGSIKAFSQRIKQNTTEQLHKNNMKHTGQQLLLGRFSLSCRTPLRINLSKRSILCNNTMDSDAKSYPELGISGKII